MLATAHNWTVSRCRRVWLTGLATLGLSLSGCAGTMDTLTSRRFRDDPFHTLFGSDDPMVVLRATDESGDQRVRAMQALKEPKKNGLTDQDQNEIVQILSSAATTDHQAVCRMSAIETLARFEDPRASQILVTAYHNAPHDAPQEVKIDAQGGVIQAKHTKRTPFTPVSSFTPDVVAQIQTRVLEALGQAQSPSGLALLCEVASAPAKKPEKKGDTDIFLQMGNTEQGAFDLRLAALRALAHYKGQAQASDVCFTIMTTEKDVALRGRAHLSLQEITGKSAAATAAAWEPILGKAPASSAPSSVLQERPRDVVGQ